MSEPLARARRVVAVGAAALAVVIVALAAAAWRLVESETASAATAGRSAATLAAEDLVRALAATVDPTKAAAVVSSSGTLIDPVPPRRFAPRSPLADAEGARLLDESQAWGPSLRRAALRRAMESTDRATSLAAAAAGKCLELHETGNWMRAIEWRGRRVGTSDDALVGRNARGETSGLTRDETIVAAGPSEVPIFDGGAGDLAHETTDEGLLAVVGGPDDLEAASLLVAFYPGAGARVVRERRALLREANALLPAFRDALQVDDDSRAAILGDGSALAARRADVVRKNLYTHGWNIARVPPAQVQSIAHRVLSPRGMWLAAGRPADLSVVVPLAGDWSVVASSRAQEARSTLLLSGLGVAAGAAVLAFVAFARSARREARLAALRTDFVATVSHELRTPVAVVRTSAETLASGRATRAEDRQALTEAIVRESERLSSLVGNVLDFARMESGRRTYAMRTTDVGALVRDVASRQVGVTVEIAADVPSIACDRDALGGAVGNLLDNARKYSSPEAPVVARVARRGGDVVVEVEDHGIGVPDAEKRHVFERFFRGADPRVRDTRGAGIGLALVEHAARAHGGRAEVADTPGGGATFRIALPIAQNG